MTIQKRWSPFNHQPRHICHLNKFKPQEHGILFCDILSWWHFILWLFVYVAFCLGGISFLGHFVCIRFCPVTFCMHCILSCDILSALRFVLWHFVCIAFCPVTFCLHCVLSCDILAALRIVLWHFACIAFCPVAFCPVAFCPWHFVRWHFALGHFDLTRPPAHR